MLTVSIEASLKVFFKGYRVSGFGVQCFRLQASGFGIVRYLGRSLHKIVPKP